MLNSASLKLLGRAVHNVWYLRVSESDLHFDIQLPLSHFGDYTISRPPCSRIVAVNNIRDRVPLQSLCQLSCNRGREMGFASASSAHHACIHSSLTWCKWH